MACVPGRGGREIGHRWAQAPALRVGALNSGMALSPGTRTISPLLAPLLAWGLLSGCVSWRAQAQRYADLAPERYVIVHPEGREQWPAVEELMARKRGEGYRVERVAFDPELEPEERFLEVSRALVERRGPAGESAYLLILASHAELPMGPWTTTGAPEGILSDLPLLAGHDRLGGRLLGRDWQAAVAFPPPWLAGRVPWDDERRVAALLEGARELERSEDPPSALLGTERFLVPRDASWVMGVVDEDLERLGWESILFAEDPPFERSFDEKVGYRPTLDEKGEVLSKEPMYFGFTACWATEAPQLVYLISHASSLTARVPGEAGAPDGEVKLIGAGRKLLEPLTFLKYAEAEVHEQLETPKAPAIPALLVTTGCTTGHPDNPLLGGFARGGWVACIWTSTHLNSPLPLIAAIRAERCVPRYLSGGLTVGMAHQAALSAYLDDSLRDPLCWILSPWSWNQRAVNVLSYVIYGDPSLAVAGRGSVPAPR